MTSFWPCITVDPSQCHERSSSSLGASLPLTSPAWTISSRSLSCGTWALAPFWLLQLYEAFKALLHLHGCPVCDLIGFWSAVSQAFPGLARCLKGSSSSLLRQWKLVSQRWSPNSLEGAWRPRLGLYNRRLALVAPPSTHTFPSWLNLQQRGDKVRPIEAVPFSCPPHSSVISVPTPTFLECPLFCLF